MPAIYLNGPIHFITVAEAGHAPFSSRDSSSAEWERSPGDPLEPEPRQVRLRGGGERVNAGRPAVRFVKRTTKDGRAEARSPGLRRHHQRTQQGRLPVPLETRAADDSPPFVDHEERSEMLGDTVGGKLRFEEQGEDRWEVFGLGTADHGRAPRAHRSPTGSAGCHDIRQQHPPFAPIARGRSSAGPAFGAQQVVPSARMLGLSAFTTNTSHMFPSGSSTQTLSWTA